MNLILTQNPINRPTLKNWIIKHNISAHVASNKCVVKRAIQHEQLKHELKNF